MYKFLKIFLALIVIAGCSPKENNGNLTIKTQNGDVVFNVEEAQKPEELSKGLMYRESLAENSGMIFDLSNVSNKIAMWMKNTKISLDMLFVNANGKIFFIHENAKPMSEELIIAPEPATFVIELNAGDVKKHGIKVGDFIQHHFLADYDKKVYLDEGKLPPRQETPESKYENEINSEEISQVNTEQLTENLQMDNSQAPNEAKQIVTEETKTKTSEVSSSMDDAVDASKTTSETNKEN